ncbi:MAG: GNAT family N-acetyltransferase [Chloroflexota bacterium]
MSHIQRIPETDLEAFIQIITNAYPGLDLSTDEKRQTFLQRLIDVQQNAEDSQLYGLYRDNKLVGGMRLFDFMMTLFETPTLVGGVGLVAVDLLHKKEKVAKEMIAFFLQHYRERGACMTALYPFRLDFYKQMGFGYGPKMNQYRLPPNRLPKGPSKAHIDFLNKDDQQHMLECYNRYTRVTHGMMERSIKIFNALFDAPENTMVGYRKDGAIHGYLIFSANTGRNFTLNEIEVKELVYESREVLLELITFVRSQADQFQTVVFHTLDQDFHYLPSIPTNDSHNVMPHAYHETNASGVGLMYRVINIPALFRVVQNHQFGAQTCTLKLTINDPFLPENQESLVIHFQEGKASLTDQSDHNVAIQMDVSTFSSLIMGVVSFKKLYEYGLATISDQQYLRTVNALFVTEQSPVCMTRF